MYYWIRLYKDGELVGFMSYRGDPQVRPEEVLNDLMIQFSDPLYHRSDPQPDEFSLRGGGRVFRQAYPSLRQFV